MRKVDGDADTVVDVFDVNGDGLPDLISFDANHWDVWFGNGNSFSANAVQWPVNSGWAIRQVNSGANGESADTMSSPMDINRDGYVDFVHAEASFTLDVCLGNGSGFGCVTGWGLPIRASIQEVENPGNPVVRAPNVYQEFFDINGDGLPDLVERQGNGWHIWRNTGSGLADYGTWPVPHSSAYLWDYTRDVANLEIGHFDMNGDGLDDIVDSADGNWLVYLNTGSGFLPAQTWETGYSGLIRDPDSTGNVKRDLFDINGDGFPDIVNPRSGNSTWEVRLNNGHGFGPKVSWPAPTTVPADGYTRDVTTDDNVRRDLIDMDGDGVPDIVRKMSGVWQVSYNRSGMADLLIQVTDTLGGVADVAYGSSRGFPQTRLPFNFWVVTSLTKRNGMTGPHAVTSTTQYAYEQGLYDFPTREFRGFAQVNVTRPDDGRETHLFHQDEARKGKERQVDVRNATGQPYATTTKSWADSVGNGVYVTNLVLNEELTYDGVAAGPKTRRTEFANHDNFGNVGLEKRLGDPGISSDDAYMYREFATNSQQWIVDRVSHLTILAGAGGARLRESWFGYDDGSAGTAPIKGNLTREEHFLDGGNVVTSHQYDAYGNRIRTTDAEGRSTSTQFDATFQTFAASITNAKGQVTQRQYNPVNGEITEETDPNGFRTQFAYDIFHRKTAEVRPYDTVGQPTTQIQYDLDGVAPERILTFRREASGQNGTLNSAQFVDGFGSLIQSRTEPASGAAWITEDLFYDAMDRLQKRSNPYLGGSGDAYAAPATTPVTTYDYDVMGRPVRVTNPDGSQINRTFDHWAVTETDENGHNKSYAFDAFQRLLQVVETNGAETYTTRYGYDAAGQLRSITDHPGNSTTINYDALGRKTAMSDPDLGAWSYAYDRVGNLTARTDARGVTTTFGYDALNRKVLVDYPRDPDVSYAYDLGTIGTLSQVTHALGSTSYQYDQRRRKVSEQRVMDAFTWTTSWEYDALDRVTRQTNPDGQVVQYSYDARGLLAAIPGVVTALEYDASGRVSRKAYANTRETTYSYHPQNLRLTRILSAGIQDLNYTYDAVGNVMSISDGITAKNEAFGYDGLDRLTSAGDGSYSRQYTYNAIGNMTAVNIDGFNSVYTYGSSGSKPHAVTSRTVAGIQVDSMVLAGGSSFTLHPEVAINAVITGTPTEYVASENADFAGAAWKSLNLTPTIVLSSGFGRKTVYFKVRAGAAESNVKFNSVNYAPDLDGDLQPDHQETDTDMDGMPDAWEVQHALNPNDPVDASVDTDSDYLTNLEEFRRGTDPRMADVEGDPPPTSASYSVRGGRMNSGGGQHGSASFSLNPDSIGDRPGGAMGLWLLQIDPPQRYFGAILLSNMSEAQTFTVRNIDSGEHKVDRVAIAGANAADYLKSDDGCSGALLSAGGQCQFKVTFRPLALGFRHAAASVAIGGVSSLATAEFAGHGGDDSDGDGMSDVFERAYGFDPFDPADAALDADGDGVSNRDEYLAGTNPRAGTPPTTLSSSVNPATTGVTVTFTATVTGTNPTGSINFTDGGTSLARCFAVALTGSGNSKTAICSTSSLGAGTHNITARYSGDAANAASASAVMAQVINAAAVVPRTEPPTTLSSSVNPATVGVTVTFTATVTGSNPTGSVNFAEKGTSLAACAAVALTGSGNSKTATCSTSVLSAGSHSITAHYSGDAANIASVSAALAQVINAASVACEAELIIDNLGPGVGGTSGVGRVSFTGTWSLSGTSGG